MREKAFEDGNFKNLSVYKYDSSFERSKGKGMLFCFVEAIAPKKKKERKREEYIVKKVGGDV